MLLILIDDAGLGNPSTFGGPCRTPALSKLADGGLRYNRFHVTALCSPTRAVLPLGRIHHAVGFGSIAEYAGGRPGYNATWPRSAASVARILRGHSYSTAAFGKWLLTPSKSPTRPRSLACPVPIPPTVPSTSVSRFDARQGKTYPPDRNGSPIRDATLRRIHLSRREKSAI